MPASHPEEMQHGVQKTAVDAGRGRREREGHHRGCPVPLAGGRRMNDCQLGKGRWEGPQRPRYGQDVVSQESAMTGLMGAVLGH